MIEHLVAAISTSTADAVRWKAERLPPTPHSPRRNEIAYTPISVGAVKLPDEPLVVYRRVEHDDGSEPVYCLHSFVNVAAPGKCTFVLKEFRIIACQDEQDARRVAFDELKRFFTEGHWQRFNPVP